ncbi:synaptopodin 2-like protein isoform 1 [Cricetulus griseus]|nr:synaptopodin 2-like protein isoform 1 [Cricetulus griseus]
MGTGDFICISMTGGAPWGFRLQGGKEQKQPLQVAKSSGEDGVRKNCVEYTAILTGMVSQSGFELHFSDG